MFVVIPDKTLDPSINWRVHVDNAGPSPIHGAMAGVSGWIAWKATDPDENGYITGRIIDQRTITLATTGELARIVDLEWWGVDSSGHFAERHHCRARAEHLEPAP